MICYVYMSFLPEVLKKEIYLTKNLITLSITVLKTTTKKEVLPDATY